MIICKCDRCEKPFEGDDTGRVDTINVEKCSIRDDARGPIYGSSYDLCPSCMELFKDWIKRKGDKKNESN